MHINPSNHQTNQISTQCDLDPGRGLGRSFKCFQMTWKGLSIRLFFQPRQVVRFKIKTVALLYKTKNKQYHISMNKAKTSKKE